MRLNLAARAGRWSAAHWKTATFGWIAFVLVAIVLGSVVGTKSLSDNEGVPGESGRMEKILDESFQRPAGETVLIQSDTLTTDSGAFESAVDDVPRRVSAFPAVTNVRSPLERANADQISANGHSAIVRFDIRGDPEKAVDKIGPVIAAVDEAQAANPQLFMGAFGDATAEKGIGDSVASDLERAGLLSLPVTIVILIIAFGALIAAGIPLLLALTGVLATMGLLAIPSHVWPVDDNVSAVVLLIGLAVGVDYSLFYLKREREERAAGRSESAALEAAAATSGRSVLISGFTVMIAMAGMLISADKTFISFGMGTILVVAVAVFASLTVLPAMLSWLGDRVEKGRVPLLGRGRRGVGESRFWSSLTGAVMRRPGLSLLLAGGGLVALAIPALGMKSVTSDIDELPGDLPVIQTYNKVKKIFPAEGVTAVVVMEVDDV